MRKQLNASEVPVIPKYNLDALGHEEFERLCQSLVLQTIGPGTKVYGMGSDGSREATFHGKAPYPSNKEQWSGDWIFQAKFHDVQQIGPRAARDRLLAELDDELSKIAIKYRQPCDNYILLTNVSLTPVFQKGSKDRIDREIIPKFHHAIKNIHVWGAEEICRLLDAHPDIRRTYCHLLATGDVIARLMGLIEEEKTRLDELVKLCCHGCFVHERSAALDDAGDVDDKPVALQQVFVDLDVKPPVLPKNPEALERLPVWLQQASDDESRLSALSYLLDDSIRGLVLVGGPGEGKSTLGQYIAQFHRARLIGKSGELGKGMEEFENCVPRIPFRVLLREYAQWIASRNDPDTLFHYVALQVSRESGKNVSPDDIHEIMKANPILLILDGLDEVSEKILRRRVLDNITSLVNQVRDVFKGDLRVMATTRPYGYSEEFDPKHYLHLTLQKLSPEKTMYYAELWKDAREPNPTDAKRILDTLDMCLRDKVVSVLTQTPLQVTILLVIIRARGTPPKQREELFERYVDIIYQREVKRRPELLKTERELIHGLHKYLAYTLHKRAEKDVAAASMDVAEFKRSIEEYLVHTDPLLDGGELDHKVDQIISEASQRLVLIESPQEGRIGFGLTTVREFFAAAHLVDTSRNTKERDSRFKAIARLPHWRNVALFFAGRVGRTRPGEAPSMIDVCREIDTEGADRFLKRGADFVIDMVDDRDLREPYNEIGAIQYGLTLFDRIFFKSEDFARVVNIIKGLPDQHKERVIRPWLEERLKNVIPENITVYAETYRDLFGPSESFHAALEKVSRSGSGELRLWALSQALRNGIAEAWTVKLLEELVHVFTLKELAWALRDYSDAVESLFVFPLSEGARGVIASVMMARPQHAIFGEAPLEIKKTPEVRPANMPMENYLYLSALRQLLIIAYGSGEERLDSRVLFRSHQLVTLSLPSIANPSVRRKLETNNVFRHFCEVLSGESQSMTSYLAALFSFLSEPHNLDKYATVSKKLRENEMVASRVRTIVTRIIGSSPDDEKRLHEYHRNLCELCKFYGTEEQYWEDIQKLNDIINSETRSMTDNPLRLFLWMFSNHDPIIEKFIDPEILGALKNWIRERNLSENDLSTLRVDRIRIMPINLKFLEFALAVAKSQLDVRGKTLEFYWPFAIAADYEWHDPKTEEELACVDQTRRLFEAVLTNRSFPSNRMLSELSWLYWFALKAGVVDEKHAVELYEIAHNYQDFPMAVPWLRSEIERIPQLLMSMLQRDNVEVARLAAVSLSAIWERLALRAEIPHGARGEQAWIGDKLWELAKSKDTWLHRYVRGMGYCRLQWAKGYGEWLKAIREASTKESQDAWCRVIAKAGYYEDKDRNALFNLLVQILESGTSYERPIRLAALERLREVVSEMEPVGFDDKPLNLPLSYRTKTSLS